MSEEQLRQLALEYAARLGPDYDHREVLIAAQDYLDFLQGKTTKEPK